MKVAVIGDGPRALKQVQQIEEIGGHSVWFDTNSTNHKTLFENPQDLQQSIAELAENKRYYKDPVQRVTKRYLMPSEQIQDKTRFSDLFRVVLLKSTQESLLEQTDKIDPKILESLKKEIEVYFDFDVVVDCSTGIHSQQYIGNLAPIIGEQALMREAYIKYGYDIFETESETELVLIGCNQLALKFILANETKIKDEKILFFWTTHFENPIEELKNIASPKQLVKLTELFDWIEKDYLSKKDVYQQKFKEWQDLEDYMKAKIKEPNYPVPGLIIFAGHTVTAVNKLIDQAKVYLSIELPDFKKAQVQQENSELKSKTLSVDRVYVASEYSRPMDLYRALEVENQPGVQKEPGVFFFSHLGEASFSDDENKLLMDQLFKWFSPKESH